MIDKLLYKLQINGFPEQTFRVLRVDSRKLALNQDYELIVDVDTEIAFESSLFLQQKAFLYLLNADQPVNIIGYIGAVTQHGQHQQYWRYQLHLFSPLHIFQQRGINRVFVNKSIPDIIRIVIKDILDPAVKVSWQLTKQYVAHAFIPQFNESDFTFITRLLSEVGISFNFFTDNENLCWHLFDDIQQVKLHDHTLRLITENNLNAAEQRVLSQVQESPGDYFTAHTDCPLLLPGQRLAIKDEFEPTNQQLYRILEVEHCGDQSAYHNILCLIPDQQAYLPKSLQCPHFQGTFPSTVESNNGKEVDVDTLGRYWVRVPFDTNPNPKAQASHRLPRIQPFGGQASRHRPVGYHYPLRSNTEVAVSFIEGKLHQPVILGALTNPAAPSPVTAMNKFEHHMSTWSGNQLLLDDAALQPKARLMTRSQQNHLTLSANPHSHQIELMSEQGVVNANAFGNMNHDISQTYTQKAEQNINHNVSKDYRLYATQAINQQAKQTLATQSDELSQSSQGSMMINIDNQKQLRAEQSQLRSLEDHIILQSPQDIDMSSRENILLTSEQSLVAFQQKSTVIRVTDEGDVLFSASEITIEATDIPLNGATIRANCQHQH